MIKRELPLTWSLANALKAGPTGLLSALLARQLGLAVCLLDAKQGPLEVGGADAITARTQQYLEVASNAEDNRKDAGILTELLNRGVKCNSKFDWTLALSKQVTEWLNSKYHLRRRRVHEPAEQVVERYLPYLLQ